MVLVWHHLVSALVLVWHHIVSALVLVWHQLLSALVLEWHHLVSALVPEWHHLVIKKSGDLPVQCSVAGICSVLVTIWFLNRIQFRKS